MSPRRRDPREGGQVKASAQVPLFKVLVEALRIISRGPKCNRPGATCCDAHIAEAALLMWATRG